MDSSTPLTAPHPQDGAASAPGVVIELRPSADAGPTRAAGSVEGPLRCVSSGYMSDGCSCPATIPERVVRAAWARQRARGEAGDGGLLRFAWQGEMWLAFTHEGHPRGVFCPVHVAERDARRASAGAYAADGGNAGLAPAA